MKIKIRNARLSYPALFEAKAFEGGEAKFSCAFLLDKTAHAEAIKAMKEGILAVAKEKWGADNCKYNDLGALLLKRADGSRSASIVKTCLRDGSEKGDADGYGARVMFFTASSKNPPSVVDRDPSVLLGKTSGKPYAGCYVNTVVKLWAQDNNFGKRINCQLQSVQFFNDGDPFGEKPVNPEEEFENEGAAGESTAAPSGAPTDPDNIPY